MRRITLVMLAAAAAAAVVLRIGGLGDGNASAQNSCTFTGSFFSPGGQVVGDCEWNAAPEPTATPENPDEEENTPPPPPPPPPDPDWTAMWSLIGSFTYNSDPGDRYAYCAVIENDHQRAVSLVEAGESPGLGNFGGFNPANQLPSSNKYSDVYLEFLRAQINHDCESRNAGSSAQVTALRVCLRLYAPPPAGEVRAAPDHGLVNYEGKFWVAGDVRDQSSSNVVDLRFTLANHNDGSGPAAWIDEDATHAVIQNKDPVPCARAVAERMQPVPDGSKGFTEGDAVDALINMMVSPAYSRLHREPQRKAFKNGMRSDMTLAERGVSDVGMDGKLTIRRWIWDFGDGSDALEIRAGEGGAMGDVFDDIARPGQECAAPGRPQNCRGLIEQRLADYAGKVTHSYGYHGVFPVTASRDQSVSLRNLDLELFEDWEWTETWNATAQWYPRVQYFRGSREYGWSSWRTAAPGAGGVDVYARSPDGPGRGRVRGWNRTSETIACPDWVLRFSDCTEARKQQELAWRTVAPWTAVWRGPATVTDERPLTVRDCNPQRIRTADMGSTDQDENCEYRTWHVPVDYNPPVHDPNFNAWLNPDPIAEWEELARQEQERSEARGLSISFSTAMNRVLPGSLFYRDGSVQTYEVAGVYAARQNDTTTRVEYARPARAADCPTVRSVGLDGFTGHGGNYYYDYYSAAPVISSGPRPADDPGNANRAWYSANCGWTGVRELYHTGGWQYQWRIEEFWSCPTRRIRYGHTSLTNRDAYLQDPETHKAASAGTPPSGACRADHEWTGSWDIEDWNPASGAGFVADTTPLEFTMSAEGMPAGVEGYPVRRAVPVLVNPAVSTATATATATATP